MPPRALVVRALTAGACVGLTPFLLAAPPAGPDPWAKAPKLPTGCYSSQDAFSKEIDAAVEALQQEIRRQTEINDGLKSQLDAIDPMKKASMMQQFMMQNPQDAMKFMQSVQSQGQAAQADVMKDHDLQAKLDTELNDLETRYKAALDKATTALYAQLKTLYVDGEGAVQADIDKAGALYRQINAEYEKSCPQWWGATGLFPSWLKRYKDHLVQDHIPYLDALANETVSQYRIFGIPSDSFRSTVTQETVVTYMQQARKVLDLRRYETLQLR